MKTIDARNRCVLFISDQHCPYSHKDYLTFLKRLKDSLPADTIIINLGDEIDGHAISFHTSDSELFSAGHELDQAIIEIQEGMHRLFPKMYLLESNHGSLVTRKMKAHGIPIRTLKPLHELYETPLWEWHSSITLQTNKGDVFCCHGMSGAYNKLSMLKGKSCVQGHHHSKFEITYHQSDNHTVFNMIAGCLIDKESLAFAYGKVFPKDPIIGTGWIDEHGNPHLAKMPLDENGRLV